MNVGKQLALEYTVEVRGTVKQRESFAVTTRWKRVRLKLFLIRLRFCQRRNLCRLRLMPSRKANRRSALKYRYLDLRQSVTTYHAHSSQDRVGGADVGQSQLL